MGIFNVDSFLSSIIGNFEKFEIIIIMIISKKVESANIRRNIDEIYAFLIEIRNTEEIFEE